jgi:hypothetical protein
MSLQVWLESVPTQHITQLNVAAGMDGLGKLIKEFPSAIGTELINGS